MNSRYIILLFLILSLVSVFDKSNARESNDGEFFAPSLTVSNSGPICGTTSITFTVSGLNNTQGGIIKLYKNNSYTGNSKAFELTSSSSITASVQSGGSFKIVIEYDVLPIDETNSITISDGSNASAGTLSAPSNICTGSSANISISSYTGTLTWHYYEGDVWLPIDNSTNDPTITHTPSMTTSYRATVSATCGSNVTKQITVVVDLPTQAGAIQGGGTYCGNSGAQTLSVNTSVARQGSILRWEKSTNGGSYSTVSSSAGQTSITTPNHGVGTYRYRMVVKNGVCSTEYTNILTQTVKQIPTVSASPPTICSGQSTNMSLSSSMSGTSFSWTVIASNRVTGHSSGSSSSSLNQTLTNTTTSQGYVTYRVTPTNNGCTGSYQDYTVYVNPIPNAIASPSSLAICSGESVNINLSSSVSGTSFSWTVNSGGTSGGANGSGNLINQTIINSSGETKTLTYTVTPTKSGCSGSPINVVVTVLTAPSSPAVSNDETFLYGDSINFSVQEVTGLTYQWFLNSVQVHEGPNYSVHIDESTTYQVHSVSSSAGGCQSDLVSVTGTVYDIPSIQRIGPKDIATGQTSELRIVGTYPAYQWVRNGIDISGATGTSYSAASTGNYSVKAVLSNGRTSESPIVRVTLLNNTPDDSNTTPLISPTVPSAGTNPTDINYIRSYTARKALNESEFTANQNDSSKVLIQTEYFDGLGNPAQMVAHSITPEGQDLITPIVHDAAGRMSKEYLPYPANGGGAYQASAELGQYNYYNGLTTDKSTRAAYSWKKFDNSALNMVDEVSSPGDAWWPGNDFDNSDRKTVKTDIRTNTSVLDDPVSIWEIQPGLGMSLSDSYPENSLTVNTVIDENQVETREYSNRRGQMVLKRVEDTSEDPSTNDRWLETYYVYNPLGQLMVVLPPEVSKQIKENGYTQLNGLGGWQEVEGSLDVSSYQNTNYLIQNGGSVTLKPGFHFTATSNSSFTIKPGEADDTLLDLWAFQYEYDARGRMIAKKVPGAGWVAMIYDKWDRLVLTQDANQRENNLWMYTKYDHLNRPIITGIYNDSETDITVLRQNVANSITRYESFSSGSGVTEYSSNTFPVSVLDTTVLTVTYYDDYDFIYAQNHPFDGLSAYHSQGPSVNGQVTGTKTRVLGSTDYLESVMYYDNRMRMTQSVSDNSIGGQDISNIQYDFIGNVTYSRTIHNNPQDKDVSIADRNEFDHGNRLTKSFHAAATEITWIDLSNDISENNGVLTKSGADSWNSGGASLEFIPESRNGYIEFIAGETNTRRMIGLSDINTNNNWTSIDYAIYLTNASSFQIRESASGPLLSANYSSGDIFRIERKGDNINYYHNNVLVRTKVGAIMTNLIVDVSIYQNNGTVQKVYMSKTGEVLMAKNDYNELGELVSKNLHEATANNYFQTVNYDYNPRGWLTSINEADLSGSDPNTRYADFFGMELFYNERVTNGSEQYNGNISGARWSKARDDEMKSYGYLYDPVNRIKYADYVGNSGLGWTKNGDRFNTYVSAYDQNGNIKKLERYGSVDPFTFGLMDDLSYDYSNGGNQLQHVTDHSGVDGPVDFGDGNTSGNDYEYDENGNMILDRNKGITDITYNHLNLPEKVVFENSTKRIEYVYDAAGIKLQQKVFDGDGNTPVKVVDYTSGMIYENDSLIQLMTNEGRVMYDPVTGFEYQYHMKDHLGNTRVTFTTKDYEELYWATMEPEFEEAETMFENLNTRQLDQIYDHTHLVTEDTDHDHSSYLNATAGKMIGPAIVIPVLSGDTVSMEVYGKFADQTSFSNATVAGFVGELATSLMNGTAALETFTEASNALTDAFAQIGAYGGGQTDVPRAFLNYMFFDATMNYQESGFDRISDPGSGFDLMSLQKVVDQRGYLYVWVSNESAGSEVWFDDLQVTHKKLPIVQADDYYPFGLTMAGTSYQRLGGVKNKYLYNGKELQEDLDLEWYDYGARMYDAAIGRWHVADKVAEWAYSRTPYRYGFNNPLLFTDPNGLFETRREARRYRKENKTGGRVRKSSDGTYSIDNRKKGTSIWNDSEYGVVTGVLVEAEREAGKLSNLSNSNNFVYTPLASIERGALSSDVPAIILHRTVSTNGVNQLNQWKNSTKVAGTHFLVGEDGTIYQTGNLKKHTVHLYNHKKQMYAEYFGKLLNSNTVGIEVIGGYNAKTKTWDALTPEQISAVANLVLELSYQLDLNISDLLPHEKVQRKTTGEGQVVLDAIIEKVAAEW